MYPARGSRGARSSHIILYFVPWAYNESSRVFLYFLDYECLGFNEINHHPQSGWLSFTHAWQASGSSSTSVWSSRSTIEQPAVIYVVVVVIVVVVVVRLSSRRGGTWWDDVAVAWRATQRRSKHFSLLNNSRPLLVFSSASRFPILFRVFEFPFDRFCLFRLLVNHVTHPDSRQ